MKEIYMQYKMNDLINCTLGSLWLLFRLKSDTGKLVQKSSKKKILSVLDY